jgi:hypothetical protein
MKTQYKTLDERLKNHPYLRERFETILNITESQDNGPDTADAVEERAIVELRKLGQEVLKDWADNKMSKETSVYQKNHERARIHKKKAHTGTPPLESLTCKK